MKMGKLNVVKLLAQRLKDEGLGRVRPIAFEKTDIQWKLGADLLALTRPDVYVYIDVKKPHIGYVDDGEGGKYALGPGSPQEVKKQALEVIERLGLYRGPGRQIRVSCMGAESVMTSHGFGAWPYDCKARELWPMAEIFYSEDGAWVGDYDLARVEGKAGFCDYRTLDLQEKIKAEDRVLDGARNAGYADRQVGLSKFHNPYNDVRKSMKRAWLSGWKEADKRLGAIGTEDDGEDGGQIPIPF